MSQVVDKDTRGILIGGWRALLLFLGVLIYVGRRVSGRRMQNLVGEKECNLIVFEESY